MIATIITNHVQQALARLLAQYQNRPLIAGLYTAIVTQIQELENSIFALDAGRQIWNGSTTPAVGQALDDIGTIVGVARNGLSDQQYILLIFGKIAENFSDDTVESVISVASYVFQAQQILIQEIYPAGIYLTVLAPAVPSSLFTLAKSLVQNAVGAGIQIVISESGTVNTFRYSGPGVTSANGYGDANTPGTGGVYAGVI